jgi:hypothetical protein
MVFILRVSVTLFFSFKSNSVCFMYSILLTLKNKILNVKDSYLLGSIDEMGSILTKYY